MLAREVYGLRSSLMEQGVVFAYCGYVTEDILTGVGGALKRKLASEDVGTTTIRSVFAVFVEQMQNIIRYSVEQLPVSNEDRAEQDDRLSYGIVTVGRNGEDYVVHAGNMVSPDDVERLSTRLGEIRGMDNAALKAAYKQRLRGDTEAFSKGAGVGFIEIARRATRPIEFDFMELDAGGTFFALEARIGA